MDIELTPEELPAPAIQELAQRAALGMSLSSTDAIGLIRHVLFQADQIEHVKVRLDPYLDEASGSPATVPVH